MGGPLLFLYCYLCFNCIPTHALYSLFSKWYILIPFFFSHMANTSHFMFYRIHLISFVDINLFFGLSDLQHIPKKILFNIAVPSHNTQKASRLWECQEIKPFRCYLFTRSLYKDIWICATYWGLLLWRFFKSKNSPNILCWGHVRTNLVSKSRPFKHHTFLI